MHKKPTFAPKTLLAHKHIAHTGRCMHIRKHTTANYQVTAGQVVVDKKETPTIVSIDDVFHSLDSLAHLNIDTILINPDDYISALDSVIYNLDPNAVNDSVIIDLNDIITNLDIVSQDTNLTEEQLGEIEDLINQLNGIINPKNSDETLHCIILDNKNNPIDTVHNGSIIYIPQKLNDTLNILPFRFKGSASIFDWFINSKNSNRNIIFYPNIMLRFVTDSAGCYKLVGIDSGTKKDTINFMIYVVDKPVVVFKRNDIYNGEFGFENYEFNQLRDTFTNTNILKPIKIDNNEYFPFWLSLTNKQTALIKVKIIIPALYDSLVVSFESSDSLRTKIIGKNRFKATDLKQGINIFQLSISANSPTIDIYSKTHDSICAKDEKGNLLGKLNVESADTSFFQHHKYKLILVKTDSALSSKIDMIKIYNGLNSYLNYNSYNQVFIKWDTIESFDTLNLIGKLDTIYNHNVLTQKVGYSFFDTLKTIYKIGDKEVHYIFISDKTFKGFVGKSSDNISSSTNLRYVIVSYSQLNTFEIYTHELGHNLGMRHPFEFRNKIPKYSTQNYMDYSNILIYFWRWQGIKMKNHPFNP